MTDSRAICFELQRPTLLPNQTLRMHWAKRRKYRESIAWEARSTLNCGIPSEPLPRARVTVERRNAGTLPDADAGMASCKDVLDVLQPPTKRHPFGIGLIQNDTQDCLELVFRAVRVSTRKEQKTLVTIEAL